jgi:hypothetical protein
VIRFDLPENVKEVPVATSVPAKTRKKARSDEDAGQMRLRWVIPNICEAATSEWLC